MSQLDDIIKNEIRKEGPITFARFMELALYHPEYGYYGSGRVAIGREGDFYTSPHVGEVFGRLVAETYLKLKKAIGSDFCHFVEMGAGYGYAAKDFLTHLSEYHAEELGRCHYIIVERSGALRERQSQTLGPLADYVAWYQSLDDISSRLTGIFFSNELVDSFPFHRVMQTVERLNELYVTYGAKGFMETLGKLSTPEIPKHMNRLGIRLENGVTTEVNLDTDGWLDGVSARLERGFIITVDYGYPAWEYYAPERSKGTLMCFRGHHATEDPFMDVGEQDITAHVYFTSLALVGKGLGLRNTLYASQSSFLGDAAQELAELMKDGGEALQGIGKGLVTLMHPDIMGSVFKVLVQARSVDTAGLFPGVRNRLDEILPPDSCWAPA